MSRWTTLFELARGGGQLSRSVAVADSVFFGFVGRRRGGGISEFPRNSEFPTVSRRLFMGQSVGKQRNSTAKPHLALVTPTTVNGTVEPRTPVIPPPGSPVGNPNVQPKSSPRESSNQIPTGHLVYEMPVV
jgi:hypothetical protein